MKRQLLFSVGNSNIIGAREFNCSVKQRTVAAGECRGSLLTLPSRHRPKPRIDCVAILGKLSSHSPIAYVAAIRVLPIPTHPLYKKGAYVFIINGLSIPCLCVSLCTKPAPLYAKIKRSKCFLVQKCERNTQLEQTDCSLKRWLPTFIAIRSLYYWCGWA